jgi:HTH-type transcriptional regulator/antitoxin MqsA
MWIMEVTLPYESEFWKELPWPCVPRQTNRYQLRVRNKLQLSQAEANKIFGGGPNAFSRYETGKALPPQALIQLLRLLDRRPELLEEIKNSHESVGQSSLAHA